jgi:predicted nucleotidyltransferase component of viral defense system
VSQTAELDGFVLAGGAALIVLGAVDRFTRDLDYFTTAAEAVNRAAPGIELALKDRGFAVERLADAAGFVRLEVRAGDDSSEVDLAHDVRLWPEQAASIGKILSLQELAADKTLALFGRAAARDYVDVRAPSDIFGIERLCELAAQKDRGFDRSVLAQALEAIERLSPERFELDETALESLRVWALGTAQLVQEQTHNLAEEHQHHLNQP